MLQAPSFWFEKNTWQAALLAPVAFFYHHIGRFLRRSQKTEKMPVPVICIGNVTLGGAGKTPVVADFSARLQQLGHTPHIISRGYGGRLQGPVHVNPALHHAGEVGDEPLLLSEKAPVWVAKNKVAGARAAIKAGATILILDDGLQNHSLHKDFSFLVLDTTTGLGNGHVFPAGPLRETFADALLKTDAVILLGEAPFNLSSGKAVLRASPETFGLTAPLAAQNLYAFTGIGAPDKFFKSLLKTGVKLAGTQSFPDHHLFSNVELAAIREQAKSRQATPATTLKDAMRLTATQRAGLFICDVRLNWQDEKAVLSLLEKIKPCPSSAI